MTLWPLTIVFLALLALAERASRRRLARFNLPGGSRRILGDLATLAALALLLTLPGSPSSTAEDNSTGVALALAVDVSASMASRDGGTSRLDRAREEIRALMAALPGARFALVPFAGDAVLQVPLTADSAALAYFVDRLSPGTVSAPGSAPEEGVLAALAAVAGETGPRGVVLFSDGERTVSSRPPPLPAGVPVYAVPLGTGEGSPVLDAAGAPRHDIRGEPLLTRLEPETLRRIAEATGGALLWPTGDRPTVPPLIERYAPATANRTTKGSTAPLALAVVLLLLRELAGRRLPRPAWVAVALCALTLACHPERDPSPGDRFADALLAAAERPAEAARLFAEAARDLEGAERGAALYNRGTLLLGAGEAKEALAAFEEAILLLPGDRLVRTNFALALRALGDNRPYGGAPGETGEENDNGGTLSRSQALQLLETVRPMPGGDAASAAPLFEGTPGRDW